MTTTADVLRKALDAVRRRGLAKMVLRDASGRVCSRGAIMLGAGGSPSLSGWGVLTYGPGKEADIRFGKVAAEMFPNRLGSWVLAGSRDPVTDFNNHADTTQADVESVLEECLRRLEAS